MAKQTINLGTAPTGVGGDTPRSAFTKANANFDELYLRDSQLGTAANAKIGVAVGNIQTVSSPPPIVGHSGYIEPGSHFITYDSNPGPTYTQYAPKEYAYFAGMRAQFPFQNCAMDLVAEVVTGTASMDLNFRTITGNGFPGPWRKIYHDGNTTRAADGTLKAI